MKNLTLPFERGWGCYRFKFLLPYKGLSPVKVMQVTTLIRKHGFVLTKLIEEGRKLRHFCPKNRFDSLNGWFTFANDFATEAANTFGSDVLKV